MDFNIIIFTLYFYIIFSSALYSNKNDNLVCIVSKNSVIEPSALLLYLHDNIRTEPEARIAGVHRMHSGGNHDRMKNNTTHIR